MISKTKFREQIKINNSNSCFHLPLIIIVLIKEKKYPKVDKDFKRGLTLPKNTKMEIKDYLANLKIEFKTYIHPPLYTCEQAEEYNKEIKGIHSKNLFLKGKKSNNLYLIIIPAQEKLDIKKFETLLNEKLTFANENELKNILNLTPGAVSPFGIINDKNNKVTLIISEKVWNSNFVSFHPNINTETLELKGLDFQKYINSLKNKLIIL